MALADACVNFERPARVKVDSQNFWREKMCQFLDTKCIPVIETKSAMIPEKKFMTTCNLFHWFMIYISKHSY